MGWNQGTNLRRGSGLIELTWLHSPRFTNPAAQSCRVTYLVNRSTRMCDTDHCIRAFMAVFMFEEVRDGR